MSTPPVLGYAQPVRNDVADVARLQRLSLICLLVRVVLLVAGLVLPLLMPLPLRGLLSLVGLAVWVLGAVFLFRLAVRVYPKGQGIVLGILSLVPFLGMIPMLIVIRKASFILRVNGVRVGLLGASMRDVPTTAR